jgi:hypothetical protein
LLFIIFLDFGFLGLVSCKQEAHELVTQPVAARLQYLHHLYASCITGYRHAQAPLAGPRSHTFMANVDEVIDIWFSEGVNNRTCEITA